jgi:D-alanine-D-alanine ligase
LGKLVCPARLTRSVRKKVEKIALRAYQALGCRDYARIDMRLDRQNRLFVLEVNPNPDLTEGVGFIASAKAAEIPFPSALRMIVEEALERGRPAAKPPVCEKPGPAPNAGGVGGGPG